MEHVSEIINQIIVDIRNAENVRFSYFSRIFNSYKYLGIEEKHLKKYGMDYYGNTFNYLYDLTTIELEELDAKLHGLCKRYSEIEGE